MLKIKNTLQLSSQSSKSSARLSLSDELICQMARVQSRQIILIEGAAQGKKQVKGGKVAHFHVQALKT